MSFGDIANRFKKHAQVEQAAVHEVDHEELYALRGRIVGVLIRDARVAKGYTVEHLAKVMDVPESDVIEWEFGRKSPSLPQIELIAYTLEVPASQFLTGTETLIEQVSQRHVDQPEYIQTRDHMIGALIRLQRDQMGYTVEYLAEQAHLDVNLLKQYEFGYQSVPLTHLTNIASVLRVNVSFFMEGSNRVGRFLEAEEVFEHFLEMDPEVRQFVAKPSNHRYIELAMRFADMEIDKLRQIAESILEITY